MTLRLYEGGLILVNPQDALPKADEEAALYLLVNAGDLIHLTNLEVWRLDIMRQSFRGSAAYEIGFLVRTTEERYRKMVDLYNTSITMDNKLRTREHILYLQKIEKLHWDITHLANMLHEVERKYKIDPQVLDKRDDFIPWALRETTTLPTTTALNTTAPTITAPTTTGGGADTDTTTVPP